MVFFKTLIIMENKNTKSSLKPTDMIITVMGQGTRIKGNVYIQSSGRIDGIIEGEVVSDQELIVGETGEIQGQIIAQQAVIGGSVKGEIKAAKKVVLEQNAVIEGDITTDKIQISTGARFNGKCSMLKDPEKGPAF